MIVTRRTPLILFALDKAATNADQRVLFVREGRAVSATLPIQNVLDATAIKPVRPIPIAIATVLAARNYNFPKFFLKKTFTLFQGSRYTSLA